MKEIINKNTGELVEHSGLIDEIVYIETRRPDGSLRIQQDFSNCISKTDQSQLYNNDINHLMKKHSVDELALIIAMKKAQRPEIIGHDFSVEPSLQDAKNEVVRLNKIFDSLPDALKAKFGRTSEFIKFVDNEQNAQQLIDLGLVSVKQLEAVQASLKPGQSSDAGASVASDAQAK